MSAVLKPDLSFRAMLEEDLTKVLEIEKEAHVAPWSEGILRDCIRVNYSCILMEHQGNLLGYAILNVAVDEAHLFNICINPRFQRQGYGRILLHHMMELCRDRKAKSMFLEVRPSNGCAVALYEDSGFVEVGCRANYYPASEGRREDALILARDL